MRVVYMVRNWSASRCLMMATSAIKAKRPKHSKRQIDLFAPIMDHIREVSGMKSEMGCAKSQNCRWPRLGRMKATLLKLAHGPPLSPSRLAAFAYNAVIDKLFLVLPISILGAAEIVFQ